MADTLRHGRLAALALGLIVLLAPACGTRGKPQDEPATPPMEDTAEPQAGGAEGALATAEEERKLAGQFDAVMYDRLMVKARQHQRAGEFPQALEAVEEALRHDPTSQEAMQMRADLQRLVGDRAGEVRTVLDDQYEAYKVKVDEQKVTVRRLLAEADDSMEAGDYDAARRAYENARFIVTTSALSPLGADAELEDLGAEADSGLKELDMISAQRRAEQEEQDTQEALRRIADQEEKALLEARDRRARLLAAAIDAFNFERFETAETYAEQVLAEEPDNTVAKDILENSRAAMHQFVNQRLLQDLKDSYKLWQTEIEASKVPSSSILQWPSQSFWDKISRIRAVRQLAGGGPALSPEEERIVNTLKTRTIDLAFDATAFPQVVNYLVAASGVNFVIDARAKEDLEAAEITVKANNVSIEDALKLIMMQASAEGEVVYDISGNIVRFIKKENLKRNLQLQIHPVADLTLGLTDFIPPEIMQVGVDEDSEAPLFGGEGEEAPQPYGTIEELMELVRSSVLPDQWEDPATINAQGKNLIVYNTPKVQAEVARFLEDLRSFSGIVVTIESRFLTVTDAFLRDVGVDFRGIGGANGGPLAVLDDITSGLDDNASAAIDNSGPGVNSGGAALAPSNGLFFNDGTDGDFRGRSENIFINPLGELLSALGGGTFQVTFLDDFAMSLIVRATEKTLNSRELTSPSITVYNTQRANLTVVNQISYVQDFDVEVAQTAFIADPVIGVIQDGLTLDVRPTVSHDRQFITMEMRPAVVDLVTPIQTFTTLLGAGAAPGRVFLPAQNPVVIQLPETQLEVAESSVRIPDGGSLLLGGLKDITIEDKKSTTPILGNIPILEFLFSRQGKSEEIRHVMVIVTATITDLQDQQNRMLN